MNKIVGEMTGYLVDQCVIAHKDEAIYHYGIEMMLLTLAELVSILAIAVFVGNFVETLLFFFAFIPLRIYAGGYHATSHLRCLLLSTAVYGGFSFCLIVVPASVRYIVAVALALIACGFVFAWAPVVHKNRQLTDRDIHHCKKISRAIAVVWTILIIFGGLFYQSIWILAFALGYFSEMCSFVFAKSVLTE